MHAGLFDVFHHAADEGFAFRVADAVHIALDGIIQETVQQHGGIVRHLDRFAHVTLQVTLFVHDFHGTPAQHVAGAHHQGVAQGSGFFQCLWLGACRGVGRLTQTQFLQQFLEALTVFGRIDHVRAGADDGHASGFQIERQFQRSLTTVLHDDTGRPFFRDNFQHIF